METEFNETTIIDQTKESIDLSVSTKGVFTWKIKLKSEIINDTTLARLKDINNKLELEYGAH